MMEIQAKPNTGILLSPLLPHSQVKLHSANTLWFAECVPLSVRLLPLLYKPYWSHARKTELLHWHCHATTKWLFNGQQVTHTHMHTSRHTHSVPVAKSHIPEIPAPNVHQSAVPVERENNSTANHSPPLRPNHTGIHKSLGRQTCSLVECQSMNRNRSALQVCKTSTKNLSSCQAHEELWHCDGTLSCVLYTVIQHQQGY